MKCINCSLQQSDKNKFCSECGTKLKPVSSTDITTGDNSVNVGINSTIDNSTINLYTGPKDDPKDVAYIERKQIKPLSLFGFHLKTTWLIYSGIISMLGSFASIFSVWSFGSTWLLLLMPLGGFAFVMGIALKRQKFAHFWAFLNIEAGIDDRIYKTVIEGDCPKCTGKLKLRSIGPENDKKTIVRCTRNPDHLWSFDPTVLDDL
ncbi:zinc ribbon domain-containing protein [Aliivibrio fischeri]|uniref:zinc ribbon domain-containing protein n=1 Tax=Aliivibrio fischeri TaxID=668 RepID=UPI00166B422E|nr:zinc ribbon domain-containing protein [Aliivibrio fischeri]USR97140.1 zinc ribbon domain-containing protein [Aliivibrio fischeri ATCC 7744 = JCM 18803 = DSM 507]GGK50821.1 hypothetical protein GCM10007987_37330 [Aliivibrio fischeri]